MIETTLLLARELWATGSAPDPAALLEQGAPLRQENAALRAENAALRAENAVLHERVQELEARLGQTSANSSRPPSSDPPQAPARPKAPPLVGSAAANRDTAGRTAACCRLSRWMNSSPWCPSGAGIASSLSQNPSPPRGPGLRHLVVELLPLAVRVTEYHMSV